MSRITVRILDGSDRGRVYRNLATPVSVGREEGNTIQLNDERISRFHLKIHDDGGRFILTDLESTNGTKVNGEDVHIRVLQHGDIVACGRSLLLFGSEAEIRRRLNGIKKIDPDGSATLGLQELANIDSTDGEVDVSWHDDLETQTALKTLIPPALPEYLNCVQSAQLAEVLGYLHARLRKLISDSECRGSDGAVMDALNWQSLLDLQAKLAEYQRRISEPE